MAKQILLLGSLIAIIFVIVFYFNNSPEKEVRAFLQSLSEIVSFESGAHPLEKLAWAKKVAALCSEPCNVTIVFEDHTKEFKLTQEESARYLGALRVEVDQLALTILDPKINAEQDHAKIKATVRGMGRSPGRDDYFLEQHEVELKLTKENGDWKIGSALNTQPLAIPDN